MQVCKSWVGGMPSQAMESDPSEELAEKYAELLATLAMELLECWKRAENGGALFLPGSLVDCLAFRFLLATGGSFP